MKLKHFALFTTVLLIFQLVDFLFFGTNLSILNDKIVFGLAGNNVLALFITVFLLIILYLIIPKTKTILLFLLIVTGAISNTVDRFIYGGVIDYIKIWFIPIFNLADVAIVVSMVIIFTQIIKKSYQK